MTMKSYKPQTEAFYFEPPRIGESGDGSSFRVKLRPLTQAERMDVLDSMFVYVTLPDGSTERRSRAWRQSRELCLTHLLAVEDHPAGSFDPSWPRAKKEEYLNQFDPYDVLIIGTEIRDRAEVTEEIKK